MVNTGEANPSGENSSFIFTQFKLQVKAISKIKHFEYKNVDVASEAILLQIIV